MTGFAWTGLNYAVPRFEQKLKAEVQESISAFDSGPVIVSTSGRDVTVSGQVGSEEEKQLLVAAVNFAPGVANVISRLTIVEALPKSAPLTNGVATDVSVEAVNPQSPILVAKSSPLPTEQIVTQLPELFKEGEFPLDPENVSVVASNVTDNDAVSEKQAPSVNIKVLGNILSIEGTMSSSDDTSSLIRNALDSFNLDVVSNGLILSSDVRKATWLDPLQRVMPLMRTMTDAQIGVANQQLTLGGVAPTREVHNAVINEALAAIGDFSLIEKISVQGEGAGSTESTLMLTTAVDAVAKAEEQARQAADAASKTKASAEQARLGAEAEAAAKASEQARLAAKATALAKARDEKRIAAEAAAKAEAVEQTRLAAETAALARAQDEKRLVAEAAAKTKAAEQARLADEAAAKAKANEQARESAIAAAKVRAAERARLAAESAAATQARAEERARIAAETAAATQAREDEQARLVAESAANQSREEERARLAAATQARTKERARLAADVAAIQARAEELARSQAEASAKTVAAEASAANLTQPRQTGEKVDLKQALRDLPSLRILFGTEGNRLTVESLNILDQIAETIIQYPNTQVAIEGHTDATGEPDQNLQLSLLRATTVRDYLIRQGVSVFNLRAIGVGEAVPLVSNDSPEGRAKNRRIEFTFR
ncbi:MAG: outer membrane protein OmpA-like peptidoglycan-associated protein [Granulosicoccus sp.]|jgi:outer membrane protein OmpA-like peptidoglycan-associated protein